MINEDFSKNLRLLCSHRRSVSQVCRDIGINRQQFNKYLNGSARPSSYNLQRICKYFGVPNIDLFQAHAEFEARHQIRETDGAFPVEDRFSILANRALSGDAAMLRRYTGFYHSFFISSQFEGAIVRAFVHLHEHEGRFFSKTIERSRPSESSDGFFSKYEGIASYLGDAIFVVEFETLSSDAIVETVLFPPYRQGLNILSGLTFGMTSSLHRVPFAARIVWKFLGQTVDLREGLSACGTFSPQSSHIDPRIRNLLTDDDAGSGLLMGGLTAAGPISG